MTRLSFYSEEIWAAHPTLKLEVHLVSAVRYRLFNIFAATLHIWRPFLNPQPEDAPCRGERDPLIMVTGTHLSWWQGPTYHRGVSVLSYFSSARFQRRLTIAFLAFQQTFLLLRYSWTPSSQLFLLVFLSYVPTALVLIFFISETDSMVWTGLKEVRITTVVGCC